MKRSSFIKRINAFGVRIYEDEAFEGMRVAGRLVAEVLDMLVDEVKVGVTTGYLDRICYSMIMDNGAVPAPLNYRGFPKSICTSLNHVVCHGIPSESRPLLEGDIINVDVTVIKDGWYGDSSRMYVSGVKVGRRAYNLMENTWECMMKGIDVAKSGATLGDIGHVIQQHAESNRFSVVREFCGHGIGRQFHEAPSVVHVGNLGEGMELEKGMMFTIEPMINAGRPEVKTLQDGWTSVTRDRSLSAQCEHTIGITDHGNEVFTFSPKGLDRPFLGKV